MHYFSSIKMLGLTVLVLMKELSYFTICISYDNYVTFSVPLMVY